MADNIIEIYNSLEAESLNRGLRGEKSIKIRAFVTDVVKQVKKPRLHMATLFRMAQTQLGLSKNDRSQFTNTVKKMYETEHVDGNVWILATKPKNQE